MLCLVKQLDYLLPSTAKTLLSWWSNPSTFIAGWKQNYIVERDIAAEKDIAFIFMFDSFFAFFVGILRFHDIFLFLSRGMDVN